MKPVWITLLALASLWVCSQVLCADADKRFYGGSYDGYSDTAKTNVCIGDVVIPVGTIVTVF